MKIFLINSKIQNCGVHQYGLRLYNILKESCFDITYHEISNSAEFLFLIESPVDVIFFNWIEGESGPFGWLDYSLIEHLKFLGIYLITMKHTDVQSSFSFDGIINQDPTVDGIPRPLLSFNEEKQKNSKFTIGSFGFAFQHKNFHEIVRIVDSQFESAVINLNITSAHFGDENGELLNKIVNQIKSVPRKDTIELNITTNFLDNQELLEFVNMNDLIAFAYSQASDIASVIDYVISTNTAIAVTNISSFRHIYCKEIDINLHSLLEIYNFNIQKNYISNFKYKWSNNKVIEYFESYILESMSTSQVMQDLFVHALLGKDGYFLDLGAGWDESKLNSNTLSLEKRWNWNGISIDADKKNLHYRQKNAKRSMSICAKIPETKIEFILSYMNAPKVIDYVSIDIEPMSIIGLQDFPFDKYEFKVLTFEHDLYALGNEQKKLSEIILESKGYYRLCNNIAVPEEYGEDNYFEDWWINPKYFPSLVEINFNITSSKFVVTSLYKKKLNQ